MTSYESEMYFKLDDYNPVSRQLLLRSCNEIFSHNTDIIFENVASLNIPVSFVAGLIIREKTPRDKTDRSCDSEGSGESLRTWAIHCKETDRDYSILAKTINVVENDYPYFATSLTDSLKDCSVFDEKRYHAEVLLNHQSDSDIHKRSKILYQSEYHFTMWHYVRTHSQLLLRFSEKNDAQTNVNSINIDVIFTGVSRLKIPAIFHGIALSGSREKNSGVFILTDRKSGIDYFIEAHDVAVVKNNFDSNVSSLYNGKKAASEKRSLFE